jgi:lysophospholipase L1-like esterase
MVHELIETWMERLGQRRVGGLVGIAAIAAGGIISWVGVGLELSPLVAVGMIVLILGLLPVNIWLGTSSIAAPVVWLAAGLVAMVVAVVLVRVGDGADRLSLAGGVVWLGGLVAFKLGLGPWLVGPGERDGPLWPATAVAGASVVAGVAALSAGASQSSELALLAGFSLAVVGLSALGIIVLRAPVSALAGAVVLAVGLVTIGAGGVLVYDIVRVVGITVVASGMIAAVSAWFVFRGEGLVAAVLVGFVLVWVVVDRTAGVADDPHPSAAGTVLGLGDSYISGEGANEYFEPTNVVGSSTTDGSQCRRAPSAYPYLVADQLELGLDFLACAGATTDQVDGDGSDNGSGEEPGASGPGHGDQLQYLLANRSEAEIEAIDVVLVSIGGNDVGFGTIVKACLLPASCDVLEDEFVANVHTLGEHLPDTYRAIKDAVPDTPIVVIPYPLILDEQTCDLAIDAREHAFVARFITALNSEIEASAAAAGVHVLPSAAAAFDGHLLCDDDPATNFLHLSPPEGDFGLRLLPSNWVHGSMHPRARGHELLAGGLAPYVEDLLAGVEAGEPPNPEPGPPVDTAMTPAELAEAEEAEEMLSSDEWISDQLYQSAGALVAPVGLLLVGGWLAAAGTVRQRWRLARFLSPTIRRLSP